jgi:hypothetical protein
MDISPRAQLGPTISTRHPESGWSLQHYGLQASAEKTLSELKALTRKALRLRLAIIFSHFITLQPHKML